MTGRDTYCVLYFQIRLVLLSSVVTDLEWFAEPECFRFDVLIHMERLKQSGLMAITLTSPYTAVSCTIRQTPYSADLQSASWIHQIRQLWLTSGKANVSHATISTRRILVIVLDVTVAVLGTVSFVLCVRSIVRGFLMWRETKLFFDNWFSIRLCGVIGEFVQPWLLLIIINDLMIVFGSLSTLNHLYGLERRSEPIAYMFGISALLVWSGVLRYVGFSYRNSLLMRTISSSIPALLRFCVCALILFFAFSLCGWVVLGPYNLKFRSFMSTMECLFSLLNGDDMFVTFSVITTKDPLGIYLFSRLFLYVFITLFIYVVLNLFITIIFEAYEQVKELQDNHGRSPDEPLWTFVMSSHLPPTSPLYKMDDLRPDRHVLRAYALGILPDPSTSVRPSERTTNRTESNWPRNSESDTVLTSL
ncbi:Mucolipin 3 [Fasciolopsis buskii]|uniref:Mucolipin 3 n=1 Tax=Fasciolopsis buskii TaxID=27845 RepID=A0A8E0S0Q8_9TREM|nr:Mucolipin 3 [Fasciolopsis buski]